MALRNQPHLFPDLYGLSAALGAELVEEATRVSLDCVLADEEFVGDFAVAHALRDQFEDFQFASRDAEIFQSLFIQGEGLRRGDRNFLDDQDFLLFREFQPQPDAERGEDQRDESGINLDRVLDDQKLELDQLQHDD